jgi:phage terminase large subunit-like protein
LVGATAADVRDVMIEGPSGLLSLYPEREKPLYEPSKRRVTFASGAQARLFSADEPDRLRGPQCEKAWVDEPAAWRYPDRTWSNLLLGLRLGDKPQAVLTTTPRPIKMIRELVADPRCHVTTGSTYDNISNLAPLFAQEILQRFEGTRLGRQEIYAELLLDVPGALWTQEGIDNHRWDYGVTFEDDMTVVAVDPSVTSGPDADETGIVAASQLYKPRKKGKKKPISEYVVTHDWSLKASPDQWAEKAIELYHFVQADYMVGEVNQGGDLVKKLILDKDDSVNFREVRATRGKLVRAEPISGLYEQGRVHHLGNFPHLEDQMCTYTTDRGYVDGSPDRLDALVWAITYMSNKRKRQWALIG